MAIHDIGGIAKWPLPAKPNGTVFPDDWVQQRETEYPWSVLAAAARAIKWLSGSLDSTLQNRGTQLVEVYAMLVHLREAHSALTSYEVKAPDSNPTQFLGDLKNSWEEAQAEAEMFRIAGAAEAYKEKLRECDERRRVELTEEQFDLLRERLAALEEAVRESSVLKEHDRTRLLRTIEILKRQLNKVVASCEVYYGLIPHYISLLIYYAHDAKPILDAIKSVLDIIVKAQGAKHALKSGDLFQLPRLPE